MFFRRTIFLMLTVTLIALAACGDDNNSADGDTNNNDLKNLNKTDMPIVDEPIKLDIMTKRAPTTADDFNDVLIWNEYEEMTNIEVDWEMWASEGLEEKRNLAFNSGDYGDVFYSANIPDSDLLKYGDQGVLIELNDLIDEYAPNLKQLFEENPGVEEGLTFPDGNIYSLPAIYSPDFLHVLLNTHLWIKQEWLDDLDIDRPETTDEFYEYLKLVKETDLIGDGEGSEIPYGAQSMHGLMDWLKGSFGVANRGLNNQNIDIDPDTNELRFYPIADDYQEMLKYVHKLYSEELIQQNIYSVDYDNFLATGADGLYGSIVVNNPESLFGTESEEYAGIPVLEGPNGHKEMSKILSPLVRKGGFSITDKNEHPEATVRWMDHFFSDEGSKLFLMGVEGETYETTEDGDVQYLDKITDSEDDLTPEQEIAKYLTWPGGGYPGLLKREYFPLGATEATNKISEETEPYLIDEIWPAFTYTSDENRDLQALEADIDKYVEEMEARFITGEVSFDDWDEYVQQIESMGLDNYMEIKQAAYERYSDNE